MGKRVRQKRYTRRLECEFSGADMTYKGFVSNVSDKGLFIRTNRSFRANSRVGIKIYLPDSSISNVRGVVRHSRNYMEAKLIKNGMGIELTQVDDSFLRLVKNVKGVIEIDEIKEKPKDGKPEKVVIVCLTCGVNNAVPSDKLSMGPKCGSCKAPLDPMEEEPTALET